MQLFLRKNSTNPVFFYYTANKNFRQSNIRSLVKKFETISHKPSISALNKAQSLDNESHKQSVPVFLKANQIRIRHSV